MGSAVDEFARTNGTATTTTPAAPVVNQSTGDGNDPSIPHEAYDRMVDRASKCRMLMGGTEAVRNAGEDALPMLEGETDESYEFRRVLCALHNGYARTVQASVGFLLEEPPSLGADMPEPLAAFAENVDRSGTHLNVFTRKLLTSGMVDGYAGIMVEHTRVPNPGAISSDDEERLGIGPYWLLYRVDDVIQPLYEMINGVRTLTLLVLREIVKRKVGRFGWKKFTQYRVYTNDRGVIKYELWEAPTGTGGVPTLKTPATAITNQTQIPWSPLPCGDQSPTNKDEFSPPLLNLADLNLEHHQCKTNLRSLETLACVPTQVRVGAVPDPETDEYPPITLGPRSTIEAPAVQGVSTPIYWHQPDISVLAPAQASLDKIEAQMGAAGMAFLAPDTRAAETAEARRIDSAAQRASLGTVGQTAQDCLELAFQFTANYLGVTSGSVALNVNFTGEGVDTAFLQVLITNYQSDKPVVTAEDVRYYLKNGQLPEDFDPSDEAILKELLAMQIAREQAAADAAAAAAASGGAQ